MDEKDVHKAAEDIARAFVAKGKLIEGGWMMYRILAMSPDAPQMQLDECQLAFFAGAQHLWASVMNILDPGEEPTAADEAVMQQIDAELTGWYDRLKLRVDKPAGRS